MYETIYFSLATFIIFSLSFNSFQEALVWSVWIYTSLVCWASWCVASICKFDNCLDMSFSNVILATFSFSTLPGFHYVYVGMLDGVSKVSFFFTVFLHFFLSAFHIGYSQMAYLQNHRFLFFYSELLLNCFSEIFLSVTILFTSSIFIWF